MTSGFPMSRIRICAAVQQQAGNTTPLMSYTIVYALSNVVLPLLGPVIVGVANAMS